MTTKKKNTYKNRRKMITRILFGLGVMFMLCSGILAILYNDYIGYFDAYFHIQQIRLWQLLPESNFVSFEVYESRAYYCTFHAMLIVDSDLTLEEIKSFYAMHYYPPYYATPHLQPPIYWLHRTDDGRNRYEILAEKNWNCD